jgi:3-oxoadipate enol-lactonase
MEIEINGLKYAYSDFGQGLPLLFVHGYPLNRKMWQLQIDRLSRRARVLTIDLPGFGESPSVPGPYSMDLLADDLASFLDALHIDQPLTLCGLSMGGYICMAFVRRYPERLYKLILTATRATADSAEARKNRDLSIALARKDGVAAIVEGMIPRLFAPTTLDSNPELVKHARNLMLESSLEGIVSALAGLKERPDSSATLASLTIPCLVIHGADDQSIPLQEAEQMSHLIPNHRLVIIPQTGHLVNMEDPDLFNLAVRSFI